MHLFNSVTLLVVLTMLGVEFSVSAYVNPNAWRLDPEPQLKMLSPFAAVLGKVMPVWYRAGLVLLGTETWLHRHTPEVRALLAASAIWLTTILATLLFLVPLNNRVIEGAAGWQKLHRTWDSRHRVRIIALAVASVLLVYAVAR